MGREPENWHYLYTAELASEEWAALALASSCGRQQLQVSLAAGGGNRVIT